MDCQTRHFEWFEFPFSPAYISVHSLPLFSENSHHLVAEAVSNFLIKNNTKTNRTLYSCFFLFFEQVTINCYEFWLFIVLFAPVVIGRSKAVFKWLSKIITWLRLLRLVIGLKESRQFFNQWEAKPKPIAPYMRDFSRTLSELQVIARNCDWFIALSAPVVIGRSNCFGFGFLTVIWKPLYDEIHDQ